MACCIFLVLLLAVPTALWEAHRVLARRRAEKRQWRMLYAYYYKGGARRA